MEILHRHDWEEVDRRRFDEDGREHTLITLRCRRDVSHYKQVLLRGWIPREQAVGSAASAGS